MCPAGRVGPAPAEPRQAPLLLRALHFKRGLLLHELLRGSGTNATTSSSSSSEQEPEPQQAARLQPQPQPKPQQQQQQAATVQQQLPRAIIIGVRKGGTRALLEMLNLHPAVVKASQEVHFFDNEQNYARGMEWYRARMPFSSPQQITIEKSPAYFVTEEVPERIFRMNASVQLLVIVREPTTRAVSDYTQVLEGKERKNKTYHRFERLALDAATRQVNTKYKAVRTSIYTKHLERWLKFFPAEQVHVVDGDRLIADPLPELQLAERFLRLPPRIGRHNLYFNATRGFYCLRFSRAFSKCLAGSKGRTHPRVEPSVVAKLQRFFHPFNQKFYQITGRTFDWP